MVNSQSPRGPVPVCVGSSRGWAAVDGGHLCSQGQEDSGCGYTFKPQCVQDLLYSSLRVLVYTRESVSLNYHSK